MKSDNLEIAKSDNLYAVILAGGGGERFWPLSSAQRPKQFLDIFGGVSLIRQAVDRILPLAGPDRTIVITNEALVSLTREELPFIPQANIIGEPCRRDTAAACAVACGEVARRGGDGAVAAILPADHLVGDVAGFRRILSSAAAVAASTGSIATIGIKPSSPSTSFGYIKRGAALSGAAAPGFFKAEKFVEKPDAATAAKYLAEGVWAWNAGMFVFRAGTMAAELERTPSLANLADAVRSGTAADAMARLYPGLERISVDYAVMEKSQNIVVAAGDFGWDDVGTWASAANHLPTDAHANTASGPVALLDAKNSLILNRTSIPLRVMGAENLVVVATENGILVVPKNRAADLKKLVNREIVES